jgi:hypothetical protein
MQNFTMEHESSEILFHYIPWQAHNCSMKSSQTTPCITISYNMFTPKSLYCLNVSLCPISIVCSLKQGSKSKL